MSYAFFDILEEKLHVLDLAKGPPSLQPFDISVPIGCTNLPMGGYFPVSMQCSAYSFPPTSGGGTGGSKYLLD